MSSKKSEKKPSKQVKKYEKLSEIDHVLKRGEIYAGSLVSEKITDFVCFEEGDNLHIEQQEVEIAPAFLKIFNEVLSNAIDNFFRSKNGEKMTKLNVNIDTKTGETSVENNGEHIPIEMHDTEKKYNHSLIFGELRTGSNFTEEDRETGGLNGYGIKLVNIFSDKFTVEGLDPVNKKKLVQTWTGNMKVTSEPTITTSKLKKAYTKVTYFPQFSLFGMEGYNENILNLLRKYVVDAAMITKIPVQFNGKVISVKTLLEYSKLFTDRKESKESKDGKESKDRKDETLYLKTDDCEVVLSPSKKESSLSIVSFVNGINTPRGGSHVSPWIEALFRPIIEKINKPSKPQITMADVKKFFRLFVVANVKNPRWDSQSKLELKVPTIEPEVKKSQISKIMKWSVIEDIKNIINGKEFAVLKKLEAKTNKYVRIPDHEPANFAGTKKGIECSLLVVEGLSAKTFAVTGIDKGIFGKTGHDYFGVLPLRGKILNVRKTKPLAASKNKVIKNIIQCLGLKYGVDYTKEENFRKLKYGRVIAICDSDDDGLHITGLLQNLFHYLFPSLLEREEPFFLSMQTILVRSGKNIFYDEAEFRKFVQETKEKNPNIKKIKKKYYKGLGSCNDDDILETFGNKMIEFKVDEKTDDTMKLVFHEKFTDARKTWMQQFNPQDTIFHWSGNKEEVKKVSYENFLNKEFIRFSIRDCARSIPSIMDGLKEGHRKVLFVTFLRNLKYTGNTLKVAQLAGSVAERSEYHHGEQNLLNTIIGMAQSFVGSNNIPLLFRDGAFGSRKEGGQDAAGGRYIYTKLERLTRLIFKPEDDILLNYKTEDGKSIEPDFYIPIIPMVLVNGALGIGTGWSTNIPCYNPLDLVDCIKVWLDNDGKVVFDNMSLFPRIEPWYRAHTGKLEYDEENNKYVSYGTIEDVKGKVRITELPVGYWTNDLIDLLEKLREEKKIKGYNNNSNSKRVDFLITENGDMECNIENLKLYKYISLSNMVLFSEKEVLQRYNRVDDIIDTFCRVRYSYYEKRKKYILNDLGKKIKFLGNKKRFLEEIRDQKFNLFKDVRGKKESRKKADIIQELKKRKYDEWIEEEKEENEDEEEDLEENEKKGEENDSDTTTKGYDYLLKLQINNITAEKINKLQKDIDSNIKEKEKLESLSEKEIWIQELDEFKDEYLKWLDVINNEKDVSDKKGKGKGKAKAAKGK